MSAVLFCYEASLHKVFHLPGENGLSVQSDPQGDMRGATSIVAIRRAGTCGRDASMESSALIFSVMVAASASTVALSLILPEEKVIEQ